MHAVMQKSYIRSNLFASAALCDLCVKYLAHYRPMALGWLNSAKTPLPARCAHDPLPARCAHDPLPQGEGDYQDIFVNLFVSWRRIMSRRDAEKYSIGIARPRMGPRQSRADVVLHGMC
jgi:hypothetical protein